MVSSTVGQARGGHPAALARTLIIAGVVFLPAAAFAEAAPCDLAGYKPASGLIAEQEGDGLRVTWDGDPGQQVRMVFALADGAPVVRALSLRRSGDWQGVLANVSPQISIVSGLRRISNQQLRPLMDLGIPINKATVDKYRWDPFWDAPLDTSPNPTTRPTSSSPKDGLPAAGQPGIPRAASEVQRAQLKFRSPRCSVRADGGRIMVDYAGAELGMFSGLVRFTVFRGTNLIKQEFLGTTSQEWVAYKYDAGLTGLAVDGRSRVVWRDTANTWQDYRLGGVINEGVVPLRAANRLVAVEQGAGAIAALPPPHKFFWARESTVNVGYNWYRKDSASTFSFGVRQNEHEDFRFEEFQGNWSLYSARPGTEQSMAMYYYPSLSDGRGAIAGALTFTNGDKYRPEAGYQVMAHHYHMDMAGSLLREKSADVKLQDLVAMKAVGINIFSPIESLQLTAFNGSGAPVTPTNLDEALAQRRKNNDLILERTKMGIAGAIAHSDESFLVLPSQEVFQSPLGGHTDLIFSKPVLWDERLPGQALVETTKDGKVYHLGSAEDFMKMVEAENAIVSMPHPRSKGSTGFPDAIKDRPFFSSPNYNGVGLRWGMGIDGSEKQLCQYRCWPLVDEMSNWMASKNLPLKRFIAISEVYNNSPGDDIYGSAPVTYVRLSKLPTSSDVSPLIEALTKGYSFWTTGEVLIPSIAVEGVGKRSSIVADVSWTFPLDFLEVTWGDGKGTGRQVISTTDLRPFGRERFSIPFDATGKKWVRFSAWDSAANGAVAQPIRIN